MQTKIFLFLSLLFVLSTSQAAYVLDTSFNNLNGDETPYVFCALNNYNYKYGLDFSGYGSWNGKKYNSPFEDYAIIMNMIKNDPDPNHVSFYCFVAHKSGGCAKIKLRYLKMDSTKLGEQDPNLSKYESYGSDQCYNWGLFKYN